MILLLDRCSVIHSSCCSLIASSPPYMSTLPMEAWIHTLPHTHTHTPTLVILDQPLCSFGQSSGCPSSPITVATELHPDSLQIGYVTLDADAPTHPHFTHTHQTHTHTHTPTHVHTITNTSLKIIKTHCNTHTHTQKNLMSTIKLTHTHRHARRALSEGCLCRGRPYVFSAAQSHNTHT